MSRSIKLLFVMMVGLALTISFAPAANAVAPSATWSIDCTGQPGAAVYSVTVSGDIAGHSVVLDYDNGYTMYGAPDQGDLFLVYGDTSVQSESATSVHVLVIDGYTDAYLVDTTFYRSTCGTRDVNHPPVADNLTGSVPRNGSVTLTLPGHDQDPGDVLAYGLASDPQHGTATINGNQLTYTPNSGYVGTESFVYEVNDAHDYVQGNVTIQVYIPSVVRPTGHIALDCRGTRKITRFYLTNAASNVAVKFDYKIGSVWSGSKVVAAAANTVVRHKGGLKPKRMVYLYAWVGNAHLLLDKVKTPRACR